MDIASGVAGLISLGVMLVTMAQLFVEKVKDAPFLIKNIHVDLQSTVLILRRIKSALDPTECPGIFRQENARDDFDYILTTLKEVLNRLKTLLEKYNKVNTSWYQKAQWARVGMDEALQLAKMLGIHKANLSFTLQLANGELASSSFANNDDNYRVVMSQLHALRFPNTGVNDPRLSSWFESVATYSGSIRSSMSSSLLHFRSATASIIPGPPSVRSRWSPATFESAFRTRTSIRSSTSTIRGPILEDHRTGVRSVISLQPPPRQLIEPVAIQVDEATRPTTPTTPKASSIPLITFPMVKPPDTPPADNGGYLKRPSFDKSKLASDPWKSLKTIPRTVSEDLLPEMPGEAPQISLPSNIAAKEIAAKGQLAELHLPWILSHIAMMKFLMFGFRNDPDTYIWFLPSRYLITTPEGVIGKRVSRTGAGYELIHHLETVHRPIISGRLLNDLTLLYSFKQRHPAGENALQETSTPNKHIHGATYKLLRYLLEFLHTVSFPQGTASVHTLRKDGLAQQFQEILGVPKNMAVWLIESYSTLFPEQSPPIPTKSPMRPKTPIMGTTSEDQMAEVENME